MSLDQDPPRRPGTPLEDDLPPTGEDAKAHRRQATAPLIWIALALVAVGAFIAAIAVFHGLAPPHLK